MYGTQGPTSTDAGGERWPINDDVIRLRAWGTERSHVLPITPGTEWIIGSGPACWLRLEDRKGRISRKHAILSRTDGKWVLRDAGSKNGMMVDGTRRDEIIVEPGLEIWFGGVMMIAESGRLAALRSFLGRVLGWASNRTKVVDQALHSVRNAATRQTALVLCGGGDLVSLARAVHRHAFGVDRPFIVCDPRRKQSDENVRAAENHRSGIAALEVARSGSLCIWNKQLPHDFAEVTAAIKDPDTRVQLIVCAREATEAEAFGVSPIAIPPLRDRAGELPRIVEDYVHDATTELGVPRTSSPTEDRDWVVKYASESLPEIEKATLRLLAIREAGGNLNRAAARLGMARWSLAKWVNRRKLPMHVVDADE
jgi:hypothetical protein